MVTTSILLCVDGCRAVLGIEEPTDLAAAAAPSTCRRNSDCAAKLVCLGDGTCGSACATDKDCPNNQTCLSDGNCGGSCRSSADCPPPRRCLPSAADDAGDVSSVCVAPTQSACQENTDCPAPLVCGADGQCRLRCAGDRDCVGLETCVFGTCVQPSELSPAGRLRDAALEAGGEGG